MIDNRYIYELDIDLDMEYLTDLVKRMQFVTIPGMAAHHRIVANDPYLQTIKDQIPVLENIYNIYTIRAASRLPLHVDTGRSSAFNIPISGTGDSTTIFYNYIGSADYAQAAGIPSNIYNIVTSPVEESFRFTLVRPVLIDNTGPHEVINLGVVDRVSISWSFCAGVTFAQAKEAFTKYSQNKRA